jgi:hypothetical protein
VGGKSLARTRMAQQNLVFFAPRTRIGYSDFRQLEYLILNHPGRQRDGSGNPNTERNKTLLFFAPRTTESDSDFRLAPDRDETIVRPMRVREVKDAVERVRLWTLAVAAYPPYADYQARTERQIPVFVAEP